MRDEVMALATKLWFLGSLLARSRVALLELEGGKDWVRAAALKDEGARDG